MKIFPAMYEIGFVRDTHISAMSLNAADRFFSLEFASDENKAAVEAEFAQLIFRWIKLNSELENLIEDSKQFEASLNTGDNDRDET